MEQGNIRGANVGITRSNLVAYCGQTHITLMHLTIFSLTAYAHENASLEMHVWFTVTVFTANWTTLLSINRRLCCLHLCPFLLMNIQYKLSDQCVHVLVCVCVCGIQSSTQAWHATSNHMWEKKGTIRWIKICCSSSSASPPSLHVGLRIPASANPAARWGEQGGWGVSGEEEGQDQQPPGLAAHRSCHSWEGREGGRDGGRRRREERGMEREEVIQWDTERRGSARATPHSTGNLSLSPSLSLSFPLPLSLKRKNQRTSTSHSVSSVCGWGILSHF